MAAPTSKYADTLASIRQQAAEPPDAPTPTSAEPVRGKGRPPGKRSDPAWKLYSHFLKKQTHREATNILRNEENGQDLSDVLEQLLEEWLIQHKSPSYLHMRTCTFLYMYMCAYAEILPRLKSILCVVLEWTHDSRRRVGARHIRSIGRRSTTEVAGFRRSSAVARFVQYGGLYWHALSTVKAYANPCSTSMAACGWRTASRVLSNVAHQRIPFSRHVWSAPSCRAATSSNEAKWVNRLSYCHVNMGHYARFCPALAVGKVGTYPMLLLMRDQAGGHTPV
jgi:hypothetical protein